jgi:FMN phosphatase YigB (HAD superfamily)
MTDWFLFDLGNTLIRLDYERVIANLCGDASAGRDELVEMLEDAGGYRDLERGAVTFWEFYEFLCENAGYRGSIRDFHNVWSDFFAGTITGAEELLDELRTRYRIAFLSNSNEVHEDVIPRQFPSLFRKDDRFIFSHRCRVAKPDPEFFRRALETLGTQAQQTAFVDDLAENVSAARGLGIQAFQFTDVPRLRRELSEAGLI